MALATGWSGAYGLPNHVTKGAIPISGLVDLRPPSCSWPQPMVRFTAEEARRESPIHHVEPSEVPLFAALGRR